MKYNKQNSLVKEGIRNEIFKDSLEWLDHRKVLKILTLPNTNFSLEKKLMDTCRCKIWCYENNHAVIRDLTPPTNINFKFEDVFEVKGRTFDLVWLDFCNTYTNTIVNNTIGFVSKNNWAPKSLLYITYQKNRESKPISYDKFYPNYKVRGFTNHLSSFIPGVRKVKVIEYSCFDQGISAPMVLHAFKIKK